MKRVAGMLMGLAVLSGCATDEAGTARVVEPATQAQTAVLLDQVKSLEGEWLMQDEKGAWVTGSVFSVSSGGHAVREVMFPGTAHEMTNMYHMDGPTLIVTHYCAVGNQPRMRARGASGNTIPFEFDSVTNKTSAEQHCMGRMTLELKDADHIEQRWENVGGPGHPPTVIELTRKK